MQKGRIIHRISNQYEVETDEAIYICSIRGNIRKGELEPVVGDIVQIEASQENNGIITQILPRKNYCKRPKIANITQMIFVLSMDLPKPDLFLLDKQLVFAKWLGIKVVICFNKKDLISESEIEKIEKIYKGLGYPIVRTNGKTGDGINHLLPYLRGEITALAGNSGVGKSSLLNRLFSEEKTEEGLISKKNKKGKNTTTTINLYKLEKDTYIADTPGFSTFSIEEIKAKELDKYFVEFEDYRDKCEFVGCNHQKETNCAVKEAVNNGQILEIRYKHYEKIYQELLKKEERRW